MSALANPTRTDTFEVRFPYTGEVVGTVPKASVDDVRAAFAAAAKYKPTLTRFQRAQVMQKAAEPMR